MSSSSSGVGPDPYKTPEKTPKKTTKSEWEKAINSGLLEPFGPFPETVVKSGEKNMIEILLDPHVIQITVTETTLLALRKSEAKIAIPSHGRSEFFSFNPDGSSFFEDSFVYYVFVQPGDEESYKRVLGERSNFHLIVLPLHRIGVPVARQFIQLFFQEFSKESKVESLIMMDDDI